MAKFINFRKKLINIEMVYEFGKENGRSDEEYRFVIEARNSEGDLLNNWHFNKIEERDEEFNKLCELVGVKDEV